MGLKRLYGRALAFQHQCRCSTTSNRRNSVIGTSGHSSGPTSDIPRKCNSFPGRDHINIEQQWLTFLLGLERSLAAPLHVASDPRPRNPFFLSTTKIAAPISRCNAARIRSSATATFQKFVIGSFRCTTMECQRCGGTIRSRHRLGCGDLGRGKCVAV